MIMLSLKLNYFIHYITKLNFDTMQLSKEEIIVAVVEYYIINTRSPKLKDLPSLPFSKKRVVEVFGTWNKMLLCAKLPLNRYPAVIVKCQNCGKKFKKQVKEIRKALRDFCGSACNAQFYTTGRKHTNETKAKISASLKAHRIFRE